MHEEGRIFFVPLQGWPWEQIGNNFEWTPESPPRSVE